MRGYLRAKWGWGAPQELGQMCRTTSALISAAPTSSCGRFHFEVSSTRSPSPIEVCCRARRQPNHEGFLGRRSRKPSHNIDNYKYHVAAPSKNRQQPSRFYGHLEACKFSPGMITIATQQGEYSSSEERSHNFTQRITQRFDCLSIQTSIQPRFHDARQGTSATRKNQSKKLEKPRLGYSHMSAGTGHPAIKRSIRLVEQMNRVS